MNTAAIFGLFEFDAENFSIAWLCCVAGMMSGGMVSKHKTLFNIQRKIIIGNGWDTSKVARQSRKSMIRFSLALPCLSQSASREKGSVCPRTASTVVRESIGVDNLMSVLCGRRQLNWIWP